MSKLVMMAKLGLALTVVSMTIGCASITRNSVQNVALDARDSEGKLIEDVNCVVRNDKGTWSNKTPHKTIIRRSSKDLQVICEKDGFEKGTTVVSSSLHAMMFGNLILGGPIGMLIDHGTGKAYDYPVVVPVEMGNDLHLGKKAKKYLAQKKKERISKVS